MLIIKKINPKNKYSRFNLFYFFLSLFIYQFHYNEPGLVKESIQYPHNRGLDTISDEWLIIRCPSVETVPVFSRRILI
jgi:hypothetical protein